MDAELTGLGIQNVNGARPGAVFATAQALPLDARLPRAPFLPQAKVRLPQGAVRVAVGADLVVEVDAHDQVVDVVLEGRTEATRPLADLGPELQRDLQRDGWDLGRFQERDQQGQTQRPRTSGREQPSEPVKEEPAPPRRTLRRGRLVETIA